MSTIEVAIDGPTLAVGRRIRELRRARGLTLVQLAAAAELSHPFLSQLERGLARPSLVSLERIARALGSSQVELLAAVDVGVSDSEPGSAGSGGPGADDSGQGDSRQDDSGQGDSGSGGSGQGDPASSVGKRVRPQSPVSLVRAGAGSRGAYGRADGRLLVRGTTRFVPMEVRGDDSDPGDYLRHAEDEFVHVVEGSLIVDLDAAGTHLLAAGDSLYYGGGTPHRWSAPPGTAYRLFVVKETPGLL